MPDGQPIVMRREYLGIRDESSPACDEYRWVREVAGARQIVLQTCNDGYGAAMIGSDTVAVQGSEFSWTRAAGSNWRGEHRYGVDLRDWSATEEAHLIQFSPGNVSGEVRIDHLRGRAEARYWVADCATAEPFTGAQADFVEPWKAKQRFAPVPVLQQAPTGEVDPGRCGVRASGDGLDGYVTHGPTTTAADANFRAVLLSPTRLLVSVEDDIAATPKNPESWVADDHLEIWLSAQPTPAAPETEWGRWLSGVVPYQDCPQTPETIAQWGIRVRDGAVFPGVNAGSGAPRARVRTAGGRTLVDIELRAPAHRLSIVYSDADGARGQEQLIATSALRFNTPDTVGFVGPAVRCSVVDGALVPESVRHLPVDPATPVLGAEP